MTQEEHQAIASLTRSGAAPALHRQIYQALRDAVLEGRLAPGSRIPSSRTLAATLGVSRPTVVSALDQLAAEGFVESRIGSGTYVVGGLVGNPFHPSDAAILDEKVLSRRALRAVGLPPLNFSGPHESKAFQTSFPALEQFPTREWAATFTRALRSLSAAELDYLDPLGYRPLRETVSEHLAIVRGVKAAPEQIMIVGGSQQALGLIAQAVADPADEAWVEDPGYPGARRAFAAAGLAVRPVPVDDEGIDLDYARSRHPHARLVHVTPSHQYPLGMKMSLARRLALVYTGRPLAPLYSLTDSGRVIHVGTFSKVIFSGMRLGYMVIPWGLVGAFRTLRGFHDRGSPVLPQAALSLFMREGRYQKHIRRLRSLYVERRDALLQILAAETGNLFRVASPDAGLHLVARLKQGVSDVDLAKSAMDLGVCTLPLSQMADLPQDEGALVLGFAGLTPEEMVEGARALRRASERMTGGDAKMAGV